MPASPSDHPILFTPGPTEVSPEILEEMARPVIGHRGEEMQAILGEILPRARTLFGTAGHDIFITGSSATGLWEAAVRNCVARKALVPVCGAFSERFHEVALACGAPADRIDTEWGRAVDPAALDRALGTGAYDAVALVHNETSTGVTNPLATIAEVVRRHPGVLLLVDVVSSLAGIPIEVDRHGIDVALASVQKCLALPPGLSLCAVSPRAMERSRSARGKGYYFDFVRLKNCFDKRTPLATPSVSHIVALRRQLQRIEAEGLEARYARHRDMAAAVRAWATERLALFPDLAAASDTVTCVRDTRGLDVAGFLRALRRRGYAIGSGYGRLKETTFRIGHMGDHTLGGVRSLLGQMDEVLEGGAA